MTDSVNTTVSSCYAGWTQPVILKVNIMAFYTRYIDIDGSYRICNPSTLNVNSVLFVMKIERRRSTCNHRRSDTALYTDYCSRRINGRLTIGVYSGPHQEAGIIGGTGGGIGYG